MSDSKSWGRLEWSVQPARYRRRLRETRLMAEGRRLKRVAFAAVFLAAITATTAFTREEPAPAGVDPGGLQLASRADRLVVSDQPIAPAGFIEPQPPQLATELATLAPTETPTQTPPAPLLRPQPTPLPPEITSEQPAWQRYALAAPPRDGRPLVAVVFDDVGVNRRQAQRVMTLPGPLTMSLMSYANNLPALAQQARDAGHELMLHIPMEPHDDEQDPGPNALLTSFDDAELRRRIEWAMDRFSGYVGVNNHMGSRFTESRRGMSLVMEAVAKRGLLFLDSRTSPDAVGYETALDHNVPAAARQVFLDHDLGPAAVRASLAELEQVAKERGYAIAIGHPHETTIGVLRDWLETLEQRGLRLAPLSAVVARNYDLG